MDAQAGLHLCCSHITLIGFLMTGLVCNYRQNANRKIYHHEMAVQQQNTKINRFTVSLKFLKIIISKLNMDLFFLYSRITIECLRVLASCYMSLKSKGTEPCKAFIISRMERKYRFYIIFMSEMGSKVVLCA